MRRSSVRVRHRSSTFYGLLEARALPRQIGMGCGCQIPTTLLPTPCINDGTVKLPGLGSSARLVRVQFGPLILWGRSSIGRALRSHRRGYGFEFHRVPLWSLSSVGILERLATNEKAGSSNLSATTNNILVPSASGLSHRTFYARSPVRIRAGLLFGAACFQGGDGS